MSSSNYPHSSNEEGTTKPDPRRNLALFEIGSTVSALNYKKLGLDHGQFGTIRAIEDEIATIKFKRRKKIFKLNLTELYYEDKLAAEDELPEETETFLVHLGQNVDDFTETQTNNLHVVAEKEYSKPLSKIVSLNDATEYDYFSDASQEIKSGDEDSWVDNNKTNVEFLQLMYENQEVDDKTIYSEINSDEIRSYLSDDSINIAENAYTGENVFEAFVILRQQLISKKSFAQEQKFLKPEGHDEFGDVMIDSLNKKYSAKHILDAVKILFPNHSDIPTLVVNAYCELYELTTDGTLAEKMSKIDIDPLEINSFYWSKEEIVRLLKNHLRALRRWKVNENSENRWSVWKDLEIELCRSLASCYLYKDLNQEIIRVKNKFSCVKKSHVKDSKILKVKEAPGKFMRPNGIPNTAMKPNFKLIFTSFEQMKKAISVSRYNLGRRRRSIDILINYRIYNKQQVGLLYKHWIVTKKQMNLKTSNSAFFSIRRPKLVKMVR